MERHDASALPVEPAASPAPWLRIYTLGRFQIDWVDPQSGKTTPLPAKKLRGQNAATALGLLKALLSCPNRFATRAWLNEQFWPNSRHRTAEERLNDVVSSLRTLLRPENCTEMFVHFVHGTDGRGAGFRLDIYPQLWCDADAFEWYVKHAMLLDQRGQDSAACWERAFYLAERGHYLPEQVYEEWARQKRDYLTGLVRDCVHRWTALLRQMGHVDEAIMRLRSYWLEHPTDEDALRPLLDMLGERERFREAEEYYEKARLALAGDRQSFDERTTKTIEAVRALQVQRPSQLKENADMLLLSSPPSFLLSQQRPLVASSQMVSHDIMETVRVLEGTANLNSSDLIKRRAVLAHLLGIPPALFASDHLLIERMMDAIKLQEETLPALYEDMLIMGWDSFRRSKSPQIIVKIDEHVEKLTMLARSASLEENGHWQSLLCRFSQLSTRIAQHRLDEPRALQVAKQAIMIAIDLDSAELIASAFYGRGRVHLEYSYTAPDARQKKKHFDQAKADIDAALGYVERVRVPLAGNIYLLAAEIYSYIAGNDPAFEVQCERWQDQVARLLSNGEVEDDGTFLKLNPTAFHHERAKTFLRFGKIAEARRELEAAWATLQPNLFTWHMNMHLTQATLLIAEGELDESVQSSLQAWKLAQTIHSHKGEVEVQQVLGRLQQLGGQNPSLRDLKIAIGGPV
jgi:DNA-binding SARP family transcriptional activator